MAASMVADSPTGHEVIFVRPADPDRITATVRGPAGIFDVDLTRARLRCTCGTPGQCIHAEAVAAAMTTRTNQ